MAKYCSSCDSLKDLNEFHVDKHRKDGHQVLCKVCKKKMSTKWGKKHRGRRAKQAIERKYTKLDKKFCPGCKIAKDYNEFYAGRNRADGLASRCKKCSVSIATAWCRKNRELLAERYRQKHPNTLKPYKPKNMKPKYADDEISRLKAFRFVTFMAMVRCIPVNLARRSLYEWNAYVGRLNGSHIS